MPIGTTRLRRSDQLRADGWVLVRLTPPGDARVQNQAVRPAGRIPEQSWPLRQAFGVQGYVRGPCPNLACGRKGLVLIWMVLHQVVHMFIIIIIIIYIRMYEYILCF